MKKELQSAMEIEEVPIIESLNIEEKTDGCYNESMEIDKVIENTEQNVEDKEQNVENKEQAIEKKEQDVEMKDEEKEKEEKVEKRTFPVRVRQPPGGFSSMNDLFQYNFEPDLEIKTPSPIRNNYIEDLEKFNICSDLI